MRRGTQRNALDYWKDMYNIDRILFTTKTIIVNKIKQHFNSIIKVDGLNLHQITWNIAEYAFSID